MTNKYVYKPSSIIFMPEGESLFSEMATTISVDDECGGPFIVLSQVKDALGKQQISLDFEEIEGLYAAMKMLKEEWEDAKQ